MDIEVATLLEEDPAVAEKTSDVEQAVMAQRKIVEVMNTRKRLLRSDQPILALPPADEEDEPEKTKEHHKGKS